jgi:hypothetical protein
MELPASTAGVNNSEWNQVRSPTRNEPWGLVLEIDRALAKCPNEHMVNVSSVIVRAPVYLPGLLQRARAVERDRGPAAAIQLLHEWVDTRLNVGALGAIDALLAAAKPELLTVDLLLSLLTATLPVRTQLSARPTFFQEVRRVFQTWGENVGELLRGLD